MTAQIIQFRDYQNPRDIARLYQQRQIEQAAAEIWYAAINPSGIVPTDFASLAPFAAFATFTTTVPTDKDSA